MAAIITLYYKYLCLQFDLCGTTSNNYFKMIYYQQVGGRMGA